MTGLKDGITINLVFLSFSLLSIVWPTTIVIMAMHFQELWVLSQHSNIILGTKQYYSCVMFGKVVTFSVRLLRIQRKIFPIGLHFIYLFMWLKTFHVDQKISCRYIHIRKHYTRIIEKRLYTFTFKAILFFEHQKNKIGYTNFYFTKIRKIEIRNRQSRVISELTTSNHPRQNQIKLRLPTGIAFKFIKIDRYLYSIALWGWLSVCMAKLHHTTNFLTKEE